MKELIERLRNEFADKEYAHSYMESHAISRLAAQVYAIRKQRGLTQESLALQSGIAQERISKIESGDFNSLSMKTLQKLARAFDVNLRIVFEPFSDGIFDVTNLNLSRLEVKSRKDDLSKDDFILTDTIKFNKPITAVIQVQMSTSNPMQPQLKSELGIIRTDMKGTKDAYIH